jgi:PadR family transcriptional regulator, regulatory protein PadR
VRQELEQRSNQSISRGAFYTTLDRLERKGLVRWTAVRGGAGREGLPQRRFRVTAAGVRELKASRKTLLALWEGLEWTLGES